MMIFSGIFLPSSCGRVGRTECVIVIASHGWQGLQGRNLSGDAFLPPILCRFPVHQPVLAPVLLLERPQEIHPQQKQVRR